MLTSLVVPGFTSVILWTRKETINDGFTSVFLFRTAPEPGESMAIPHGCAVKQGVAAPYTRGVVEGNPSANTASTSATVTNSLRLRIFFLTRRSD